jgi:hypothetical protein
MADLQNAFTGGPPWKASPDAVVHYQHLYHLWRFLDDEKRSKNAQENCQLLGIGQGLINRGF